MTPDGRYFVVAGRLWRRSNPSLPKDRKDKLVQQLMKARRAVRTAKAAADVEGEALARRAVERTKRALGERGSVWWTDGAPDFNKHLVKSTPYADWFASIDSGGSQRLRA